MSVASYFEPRVGRNGRGAPADIASALKAEAGQTGKGDAAPHVVTHTLTASHGATEDGAGRGVPRAAPHDGMSVRRLTPVECEKLMGWPSGWTQYRADGREIPDGPRYRMCGNGVVAPVAEWIARRMRAALLAEVG